MQLQSQIQMKRNTIAVLCSREFDIQGRVESGWKSWAASCWTLALAQRPILGGARGKDGRCFHTAVPEEEGFKDADNVGESVLLWQMHVYQTIQKLSD